MKHSVRASTSTYTPTPYIPFRTPTYTPTISPTPIPSPTPTPTPTLSPTYSFINREKFLILYPHRLRLSKFQQLKMVPVFEAATCCLENALTHKNKCQTNKK